MTRPSSADAASLRDAEPTPFWLDDPDAPEPAPALTEHARADLAVVGGGFSGLWTALLAKERDPSREVILLEADRIAGAATGRNGGFCAASLTHGLGNGMARWPSEIATLERLGRENLNEIADTVARHDIDCHLERTGDFAVATDAWQVPELQEYKELGERLGGKYTYFDADAMRAEIASPTYQAGLWDHDGTAMVNPARLAWGLRAACLSLGVRIHERTAVTGVAGGPAAGRAAPGLRLTTPYGSVTADRVALGTGVFPSLLRRLRPFTVPVYDYVLMTEPLSPSQRAAIGWGRRQGVGDSGNQFHYYRLTADDRILWGGYDAVYHYGGNVRAEYDRRPATFRMLAHHFFATFPQLEGVRFTHGWGGAIDTCTRFSAFFGTAMAGRVAYALGYTGLGVGATRFGANVMLDLLAGDDTERTRLTMVRRKPIPFPPEPLKYGVIQLTRSSIARADRNDGRRDLWLRTLDRFGVGYDS